jgi:hypothetical protein
LGGKQQDSNHDVPNIPNVPTTTTVETGTSPVEVEDVDVTAPKLPADIAKRDAVVQMFKVSAVV